MLIKKGALFSENFGKYADFRFQHICVILDRMLKYFSARRLDLEIYREFLSNIVKFKFDFIKTERQNDGKNKKHDF